MGGGLSSCENRLLMLLYLGLFFASQDTISPNSLAHWHHFCLASGAPNAFFRTSETTPSKVGHTRLILYLNFLPDTLWIIWIQP